MLKQIKETNEKIINEHFKEVFGEQYKVSCNWGFPVVELNIDEEDEENKNSWKIIVDMIEKKYNINSFSSTKDKDGNEKAKWSSINNDLVDFVIERTALITSKLFTTAPVEEEKIDADVTEDNIEEKEQEIDGR